MYTIDKFCGFILSHKLKTRFYSLTLVAEFNTLGTYHAQKLQSFVHAPGTYTLNMSQNSMKNETQKGTSCVNIWMCTAPWCELIGYSWGYICKNINIHINVWDSWFYEHLKKFKPMTADHSVFWLIFTWIKKINDINMA